MKISMGILAYNEAESISNMLYSLWEQSLFQDNADNSIEVIVVANGCTDNTAEVARNTLKNLFKDSDPTLFQWQVCEVKESGKSNAWNLFVHQFSAPDADFFCIMDADIQLYAKASLEKMLDALVENPEYWVSLDGPIKDVKLKKNKNLLEKLSVAVSSNEGHLYICGQLYCARASALRDIWMPIGLHLEDGFLTQMVVTENHTVKNPTFEKRIVRVQEASHVYEAYTNPTTLINHEIRVVMGIVVNIFLRDYFREKCGQDLTAGELIVKLNEKNRFWLDDFIKEMSAKNWWSIPTPLVFRRYRSLQNYSFPKALARIPIATLAFIVDLGVFFFANRELHKEVVTSYW
ncbi:glycosyltransferase [Pleurocapsales cyanobacterium LEGE 10410]|nr:glycosyltransferase [Pleurocapsales cyanobacterium LEGE 10410]